MAQSGIASAVLKYLDERHGLIVHANDIAKDLNLTKPQVNSAIFNLRSKNGHYTIESVSKGVYRFHPTVKADHTLFECIGKSKQGKLILQDEEGDLYVAEKL